MFLIKTIFLLVLVSVLCYINTGDDEKNFRNIQTYPTEVQDKLRKGKFSKRRINSGNDLKTFLINTLNFTIIFFFINLNLRGQGFIDNFIEILALGQILNLFDLLVIDLLWWRNTKRVRFRGTENMDKEYKNPEKHYISFLKAIPMFVIVALVNGLLLSVM